MSPRAPHRFYFDGRLADVGMNPVRLSPAESHHLLRVLRLRPGMMIEIFDGSGGAAPAEVAGDDQGLAIVRLLAPPVASRCEAGMINLAVALLKRRPMDWLIEKISELGVGVLQPLLADRCVGLGDVAADSRPPERWVRIAVAAAKQSGRNRPLALLSPTPAAEWARQAATTLLQSHDGLFADFGPEARPLGQALAERAVPARPLWIAIGPEGGWTPAETKALASAGFQPVGLGKLVLRAETAALTAAAVCRLSHHSHP